MMKDPRYTEDWVDDLALRIRHKQATFTQLQFAFEAFENRQLHLGPDHAAAEAGMPAKIKFSRASETNVATLRNLPPATNILLFTPVIIPAGQRLEDIMHDSETVDPFEAFGRALSTYHRRIRHVPYVAKVGFTGTHEAFVSQADAVITVVCEPEVEKHRSVSNQMDFAEATLDSLEGMEANASSALVLVQCGANEYRLPVDASFMNVIECQAYNADNARHIAQTIFEAGI